MKLLILLGLVLTISLSGQDSTDYEANEFQNDNSEYREEPNHDEDNDWDTEDQAVTDEIIFYKDHIIPSGEISYDNIRIIGGDLIVDGVVKGKITLIGGDVRLNESAVLDGQIEYPGKLRF